MNFYKFLLISIIIGSAQFFSLTVNAQEASSLGLSVSPQIFEFDIFPGETRNEKIILKNLSDVPVPISVRATDFSAEDNSGEMEFDSFSQDPVIASYKWFQIKNPDFILDANGKKEVDFEISVPKSAEIGGRYSVIFFEPQLPSFYFKPGQPRAVPVIGVLFLISVRAFSLEPVLEKDIVKIIEFKIPEEKRIKNLEKLLAALIPRVLAADISIVEKTPESFLLKIKNNDIFHHKLQGKVSIYNFFGKKVGETEIKKTTILPNKIRQFPVDISEENPDNFKWLPAWLSNFLIKNTSIGRYKAVLELAGEKKQIALNQTLSFWAFPWKIITPILVLIILAVILRKRIIAAVKILVFRNHRS